MAILVAIVQVVLDVVVQTAAVVLVLRLVSHQRRLGRIGRSFTRDALTLASVMVVLFVGHLIQIGVWAHSFLLFGEFETYRDAFYHSAVNYATLGYGDIVMSEDWRMLGALEAASGVLMFGVSTATFFAILGGLLLDGDDASR